MHIALNGNLRQIADNHAVLNHCREGIVQAGEGVEALGSLFSRTGSHNHLAVEHDIHVLGIVIGGVDEAVQQIGFCVGHVHVDGLLRAGDNDGLGGILDHIGKRRRRVCQRIRAVADHESVVFVVVFLDRTHHELPVLRGHIGGVEIAHLHGMNLAHILHRRNMGQDIRRGQSRCQSVLGLQGCDGTARPDHQYFLHLSLRTHHFSIV